MDIQGWEPLWKTLATIGIANLLLFFIVLIWILIGIESACYLGILIVRWRIRQLLR